MRVLLTGAAGFIGSHLSERLLREGHEVVGLDSFDDFYDPAIKEQNLSVAKKKEGFSLVRGDIRDAATLAALPGEIDTIIHPAARTGVRPSIAQPGLYYDVNVMGTLQLLEFARERGINRFVFASSSSVYGDTYVLPMTEDMTPNPQSPYAVTKLAGECYCRVFQEVYGLPTVCLRYFNVYGPRQDPHSQYAAVIPRFIKRVSEKSPPIIFGDGEQTRDFTFVTDAVEANILAAESNATGIFNIGRGRSISINQLAGLTIKLIGNNIEPIHTEPRPGDIRHSLADISKAKTVGYNPRYSLEEGLREIIRRFQHET